MREVVIIGGGLTGLAAAWELERLGIGYTLIEVKPRLGGSLKTERENGFLIDTGAFGFDKHGEWPWLAELGLLDALDVVGVGPSGERVIFKNGAQTLVDALTRKLTNPIMYRMAVSSLGHLDQSHFGVCLENGLALEAQGLIITAPARYAEHMLRSLSMEAAYRLVDYRYDSVARVSLGYRIDDLDGLPDSLPDGYPITFVEWTESAFRVPDGHILMRIGIRNTVEDIIDQKVPLEVAALMEWPLNPLVKRIDFWPEADPISVHGPDHPARMQAILNALPKGVALAGSDYMGPDLNNRIEAGRAAARGVVESLQQR